MSLFLKSLKELPPFGQALGMVLEEADTGPGVAVLLPGAEHLSGDAEDAVFHTSVILATIDNTAGWCIRDHPDYAEGTSMATLDLRVDFVTPARLSETLRVRAVCEGFDGDIAFVRATAQTLKTKGSDRNRSSDFYVGYAGYAKPCNTSKRARRPG